MTPTGTTHAPVMHHQVAGQLLRLNRAFYDEFYDEFAQTRDSGQISLQLLLPYLPVEGSLLDAGCGNGRLALTLDLAGRWLDYWGVDASAGLLGIAHQQTANLRHVRARFIQADLTAPGWTAALPYAVFDAIASLAVLHHIPSWRLRLELLTALRSLLAPEAILAVSTWQFLNSPRLSRKIVSWAALGLAPDQVEPGDYLLDWRRGGRGLRYCHLIGEAELSALAASAGFVLETSFLADGQLNLFAVLRAIA